MRASLSGWVSGLVVFLAVAPVGTAGDPDSKIEAELAELAKSIAQVLRERDVDTVSLGAFKYTPDPEVSHSPGICQQIARELASLGIKIDAKAHYLIEGNYSDKIDKKSRRVIIELNCNVLERKGKNPTVVGYSKRGFFGQEAYINFLTPAAIVLDPSATQPEREESFIAQNDSDKPLAHLHGSKIFASAKEEYGVEFLVKTGAGYLTRKPVLRNGKLYVPLEKDEPFAVRLVNSTDWDAAATIHIDGLDVFSFSDMMAKKGVPPRWIVAKKKDTAVLGWPIRVGLSHEFLVTEYAKSAVAELNAAGKNVGVITVTFAAAWPKGSPPPEDEKARNTTAVGRGAPVNTPFQVVPMSFGAKRAILNVRYQR